MAQGKAWDREKVFEAVEPYLKLGYSVGKACDLAEIPRSTFAGWLEEGVEGAEELRLRIVAIQNRPKAKAREVIIKSISNGNVETSKWFLERTERDEFSTKTDVVVTVNEVEKKTKKLDGLLDEMSKEVTPASLPTGDTSVIPAGTEQPEEPTKT